MTPNPVNQVGETVTRLKKFNIFSILVLGHGVKLFGHAIIDEIFLFLFCKRLIGCKRSIALTPGLMIGLWGSFCAALALLSGPLALNLLHCLHSLTIGLAIVILSQSQWREDYLRTALPAAAIYLGCNVIFLGIEQFSFVLSGYSAIECLVEQSPCEVRIAFWQEFWTGTAYSSLGLFISTILLIAATRKQRTRNLITLIYFVIAALQLSKASIFLGVFVVAMSAEQIGSLLKLLGLLLLLSVFELCLWLLPVLDSINAKNFLMHAKTSYAISSLIYFYHSLFYFYEGFFDLSRLNQLTSLWNYINDQDLMINFFGQLSGFHRYDLRDYFTQDSSGMLRPIGIVVWVVDFGFIFVAFYLWLIFCGLMAILKYDFRSNLYAKVQCLLTFGVISIMPVITNLYDSMLFWFVLIFPELLIGVFRGGRPSPCVRA